MRKLVALGFGAPAGRDDVMDLFCEEVYLQARYLYR